MVLELGLGKSKEINAAGRRPPEVNRITHEKKGCAITNVLLGGRKALNLPASFPAATGTGVMGLTWFSPGFWDPRSAP